MKLAFSWGEQIEGFVSLRFPELAGRLDFTRTVPPQSEFALETLGLVRSDLVRLIPGLHGGPGCLLVLEFQSRPDPDMPVRLMLHASQAILQLRRANRGAPVPRPLPGVIATGDRRRPDGPASPDGLLEPPPWSGPPGVSLSFDLTDLADPELDLSAPDNYASLRAVMRAAVLTGTDLEENPGTILPIREEGNMSRLAESQNEAMARKKQEGLSQGLNQGRSEGQRKGSVQTLSEFAEHRFGPEVAEAQRPHLARIGDPDEIRRTGLALLECGSGTEVLARLRSNEHDPAADGP